MDEERLTIYIDGSALKNPGELVGCAGIVVYPPALALKEENLSWRYSNGTSGSMELTALVNAIKWVNRNASRLKEIEVSAILILSDSQYVVNSANSSVYRWADGFNKNKWKKLDGGTVKHQGLWKEYLREKRKSPFAIEVSWIEGKSTPETKAVDKAAKVAAKSPIVRANFGYVPYKQGRSLLGKGRIPTLFSEVDETHLIRVYSHAPVSRKRGSEYEIRFEVVREDRVEGPYKAFTTQEIGYGVIDRQNFYEVTFNGDTALPMVVEARKLEGEELSTIKARVKTMLGK